MGKNIIHLLKCCDLAKEHHINIKWIDIGGGIGLNINLRILEQSISKFKNKYKDIQFYMEPGRYIVSQGGVLISEVTQIKKKDNYNYIGLDTGMNSLIRPALYDAYHPIYNLSKIDMTRDSIYRIVGPICESGDILGKDRIMPKTYPGDLLLIENCGAYGYVMSSRYNLREPAMEIII